MGTYGCVGGADATLTLGEVSIGVVWLGGATRAGKRAPR